MVDVDEAPERAAQGIEDATLDAIDGDRARFENTGNPLFAWQALASWIDVNRSRASDQVAPLPIPDWIAGYLRHTSTRILGLANGRDFDGPDGLTRNPARAGNRVGQPRRDVPRVTPGEAMRRVPAALGLIHKRWNAFKHLRELNSQEIDEMSVELYKETEPRVGDGRAFEMLREDKGGRRARSSPPYRESAQGQRRRAGSIAPGTLAQRF
jgi:hypothetical protein